MKQLVYIVGVSTGKLEDIKGVLETGSQVKRVTRAGLMTAIYQEKPACLVIIESDLDKEALSAIAATIAIDFIPVICVGYRRDPMDMQRVIDHATYISGTDVDRVLPLLVEQAAGFSGRVRELQRFSDTYEVMNEEIGDALDNFVDARIERSEMGMLQYMDMVYRNNMFLDNWPAQIWVLLHTGGSDYKGILFDLNTMAVENKLNFYDETFSFADFVETGFLMNSHEVGELSDINSIHQMMPEDILKTCGRVTNVASHANRDVMLVAMNYGSRIGQVDLNILKALTLKVDLMINIKTQVNELEASFVYTMNALARAAEGKDDVTGHHIRRVNMFAGLIAGKLGMDRDFVGQIEVSAQMHDVGKIMVPDSVLNKPARLTDDEFEIIQSHTVHGEKVIGDSIHLEMASKIARSHHEKYDGSGYPDGLKGEEIPMAARIVAIGDIYDALRSPRPYKKGFTHEEAYDIIVHGDGRVEPSHFDPEVLEAFKEHHHGFNQIYESLKDPSGNT